MQKVAPTVSLALASGSSNFSQATPQISNVSKCLKRSFSQALRRSAITPQDNPYEKTHDNLTLGHGPFSTARAEFCASTTSGPQTSSKAPQK